MRKLITLNAVIISLSLLFFASAQAASSVTFYHHDALGSVIATSNQSGNMSLNEEYQPYGEKIYQTQDFSGGNEDWYTGKNYSKELDLTYFGARWYDAKQGRFLSMDPAPVVFENPHSFNRYIYAYNNPYKYIDPDGLAPGDVEDANGDGVPDTDEIEKFTIGASKAFNDGTHRIAGDFLGGANGRIPPVKVPKSPGQTVDPTTGTPVGRFITDSKGNTMIEPVGGSTVGAGRTLPGAVRQDTHTTYPNGSTFQRLNASGHGNNPTPHGHGHGVGSGPGMRGQGPALDVSGNQVPRNSPAAHWPAN